MTCTFCDYIGAGLLAIPMAASELTSLRLPSGEWVAPKVVRRSPAVILPCYLKRGSRRQFLGGTAKSSNRSLAASRRAQKLSLFNNPLH